MEKEPMAFEVIVDQEKCKGCEECIEVCTSGVFSIEGRKSIPIQMKACIGCKSCVEVCKEKAITVRGLEKEMSEMASLLLRDLH
jgi:NAD-dependent dihydropyrimidine dehydrogenase PreA subunit